ERFGPVDREDQRGRLAEELALLAFADLADEIHEWVIEQGTDRRLEILDVEVVDLRRDLQRHVETLRHLDGSVDTLLRTDAAEEREVVARRFVETVRIGRETVVDGR